MISIWGKKTMNRTFKLILSIFLLLGTLSEHSFAQSNNDIALILKSVGKVKVKKDQRKDWKDGSQGSRLDSGDIIRTYEKSLAAVLFTDDKSLLKVRDNSTLAISGKRTENSIAKRLKCALGNFWLNVTQQKSQLLVETPSGVAAVKGTEFYGIVDSEGNTVIIVIEGIVQLMNKLGEGFVKAGQTGKLSKDSAPEVFKTDPNSLPNWANDGEILNEMKFEFEDSDGNKKNLKINYK